MNNKGKTIRRRSHGSWDNGDCLSHMPTATNEQLNIAKILQKSVNDNDLKQYVSQVRELTDCTEDEAVTALYDCENNLDRAVELLLDKLHYGNDNEWQTSVGKRTKTKSRLNTDTSDGSTVAVTQKVDTSVNGYGNLLPEKRTEPALMESKVKKERKAKRVSNRSFRGNEGTDQNSYKASRGTVQKPDRSDVVEKSAKERSNSELDGWDPYTEYGEWTGELIEVVNSDVNIAKGLEDCLGLQSDILVESDNESNRESEVMIGQRADEPLNLEDPCYDPASLFVNTARSKRPPPPFINRASSEVWFAPEILHKINSKTKYVFGNDWAAQALLSNGGINDASSLPERGSVDSQRSTLSNTNIKMKHKTGSIDSSAIHPDKIGGLAPNFTDNSVSANSTAIKNASLFSPAQQKVSNSTLLSENNGHSQSVIGSAYKDYILDGLANTVTKMSVEQVVANNDSYVQQPTTCDSKSTGPNLISQSAVAPTVSTQKNAVSHASGPPLQAVTSQAQQSSSIPHPVPHFVQQFAPSPYMFNMPGSSGNPPTLFELDQLQLLQQHRILYDMHLQQQAATTVQSVVPPTDASSAAKTSGQGLPAPLVHVTAANTSIRPDIITSTVGHATQLMQSGHPYFHYPRFVLMNGYHNAYLNQQQTSQDGNASGNTSNQLSNAAVIHGALPVTQSDGHAQSYNNMKVPHTYNDLLDLKYGDPTKQVGFKSTSGQPHQQPFVPFSGQGIATTEATKQIPSTTLNQTNMGGGVASSAGYPAAGNAVHFSQQPQQQSQQFYPSVGTSPYFTAVAAAAVAAASAQQQQQQQQHVMGGPGSQPSGGSGGSAGPNQMAHMHNPAGAPTMVYPGAGLHVHHGNQQRSVIPH